MYCVENEWIVHIFLLAFQSCSERYLDGHFLRAPFLPRAPLFHMAHTRLRTIFVGTKVSDNIIQVQLYI